MPTLISRKIYYRGRVQGVGFRYSVKQIATGYDVVGWVRNLDDGRVEVEATGAPTEVQAFSEAIAKQMATYVQQVEHVDVETPGERVKSFDIRH